MRPVDRPSERNTDASFSAVNYENDQNSDER